MIDDERLKTPDLLFDYFDELLQCIQDICYKDSKCTSEYDSKLNDVGLDFYSCAWKLQYFHVILKILILHLFWNVYDKRISNRRAVY